MVKEKEPTSKDYRDKGNECVKDGKYLEAVLNYTFAIKFDPRNAELYSNRSHAFLKTDQYYYSLEDAENCVKLKPLWAKGYYRKAEVLFKVQRYKEALEAYQKAFHLQPEDKTLMLCIKKTKLEFVKLQTSEKQLPWLGTAIGIILGIFIVLFEYVMLENKLLPHPFLQVVVIIIISLTAYGTATLIRKFQRSYRSSLMDKPIDLFANEDDDLPQSSSKGKKGK